MRKLWVKVFLSKRIRIILYKGPDLINWRKTGTQDLITLCTSQYVCMSVLFVFNTEDIGLRLVGRHDLLKEHDTETQPQLQEGAWRGSRRPWQGARLVSSPSGILPALSDVAWLHLWLRSSTSFSTTLKLFRLELGKYISQAASPFSGARRQRKRETKWTWAGDVRFNQNGNEKKIELTFVACIWC